MVFQWSLALGDQRLTMSKNLKTSLHWNMSINGHHAMTMTLYLACIIIIIWRFKWVQIKTHRNLSTKTEMCSKLENVTRTRKKTIELLPLV